jgi:hypothetical protein
MNDVREAIERAADRFAPPGEGLGDLARRRNRVRARRRIAAGAFALTIAAGASLLAFQAFRASPSGSPSKIRVAATSPTPTPANSTAAASDDPVCPTPSGDSPPAVILVSTSGPAGSSVGVSGTFQTGQRWFQLWWNADGDADKLPDTLDQPPWPPTGPDLRFEPAGPGPAVRVASVAGPSDTGDCSFRTEFTVPDVGPGTYHLVWAFGAVTPPAGGDGYGLFTSPVTFEVTG